MQNILKPEKLSQFSRNCGTATAHIIEGWQYEQLDGAERNYWAVYDLDNSFGNLIDLGPIPVPVIALLAVSAQLSAKFLKLPTHCDDAINELVAILLTQLAIENDTLAKAIFNNFGKSEQEILFSVFEIDPPKSGSPFKQSQGNCNE